MCVQTVAKCPPARVAIQPPSVDSSNDCGKKRIVSPCSASWASSAAPATPAWIRAARETASTSSTWSRRDRSSETTPSRSAGRAARRRRPRSSRRRTGSPRRPRAAAHSSTASTSSFRATRSDRVGRMVDPPAERPPPAGVPRAGRPSARRGRLRAREEDVEAMLEWAAREDVAVIPFGGGTSVVGGVEPRVPPTGSGSSRSTCRTWTTCWRSTRSRARRGSRPASPGPALEAQLAEHGLTMRFFPQSFELSTLGGWIATRAGGHFATAGRTSTTSWSRSARSRRAGRGSRGGCRAPAPARRRTGCCSARRASSASSPRRGCACSPSRRSARRAPCASRTS